MTIEITVQRQYSLSQTLYFNQPCANTWTPEIHVVTSVNVCRVTMLPGAMGILMVLVHLAIGNESTIIQR